MEKQNRVPQIYGFSVCLVAVITVLISVTSLMNAVIDLGDPLHAVRSRAGAPSLASFENYKMDILRSSLEQTGYAPDDQALQKTYAAAKAEIIRSVEHGARRSLIVSGFFNYSGRITFHHALDADAQYCAGGSITFCGLSREGRETLAIWSSHRPGASQGIFRSIAVNLIIKFPTAHKELSTRIIPQLRQIKA